MTTNRALVLGCTNNYVFTVANLLIGLFKESPGLFSSVFIFVDNKDLLSRYEHNALSLLAKHNNFILKIRNHRDLLDPIMANTEIENCLKNGSSAKILQRFSYVVYLKNFMYKIFYSPSLNEGESFDELLYLDSDILINGDISSIFNHGSCCAIGTRKLNEVIKPEDKNIIFPYISNEAIKPNGGVFLLKRKGIPDDLDPNHIDSFLVSTFIDLIKHNYFAMLDEILIVAFTQKFKIYLDIISSIYNYVPIWRQESPGLIIHSAGQKKFWNSVALSAMFRQWSINNKIWLGYLLIAGVEVNDLSRYNHYNITQKLLNSQI